MASRGSEYLRCLFEVVRETRSEVGHGSLGSRHRDRCDLERYAGMFSSYHCRGRNHSFVRFDVPCLCGPQVERDDYGRECRRPSTSQKQTSRRRQENSVTASFPGSSSGQSCRFGERRRTPSRSTESISRYSRFRPAHFRPRAIRAPTHEFSHFSPVLPGRRISPFRCSSRGLPRRTLLRTVQNWTDFRRRIRQFGRGRSFERDPWQRKSPRVERHARSDASTQFDDRGGQGVKGPQGARASLTSRYYRKCNLVAT